MQKIILYTLFLMLGLFTKVYAQQMPQNEENDVRKVIETYYDAWNQHDVKKMAELYATDGDLRTPWNQTGKNRKEVETIYASQQTKQMKNAHINYSLKSIRMIKPSMAFVDSESTITGMQTVDAKQYSPLHHHVIFVLVKRDGKWQILIGRPF
jgi:uncharacterized protein (TIGR02246 family)